jgi:hypothetical protein
MGALPSMCRNNMTNLEYIFQAAVIQTRSYVPTPIQISASLDKMHLLCMSVCQRYQVLSPCICVPVKWIFGHFVELSPTRVRNSVMTFIHFRSSQFSDKRLSETTKLCRKRQTLVGRDKALSETTNACRKRQSFVGKFILS